MSVYVVYPGRREGWELLREGDPDTLHFRDREQAIGYGRSLADVNRPSALKVETRTASSRRRGSSTGASAPIRSP